MNHPQVKTIQIYPVDCKTASWFTHPAEIWGDDQEITMAYKGAIYLVTNRGDRREAIFKGAGIRRGLTQKSLVQAAIHGNNLSGCFAWTWQDQKKISFGLIVRDDG